MHFFFQIQQESEINTHHQVSWIIRSKKKKKKKKLFSHSKMSFHFYCKIEKISWNQSQFSHLIFGVTKSHSANFRKSFVTFNDTLQDIGCVIKDTIFPSTYFQNSFFFKLQATTTHIKQMVIKIAIASNINVIVKENKKTTDMSQMILRVSTMEPQKSPVLDHPTLAILPTVPNSSNRLLWIFYLYWHCYCFHLSKVPSIDCNVQKVVVLDRTKVNFSYYQLMRILVVN